MTLFHIAPLAAWHEALSRGAYTADSLTSEGFIHCSEAHQVERVANQRFRGRPDLVLLLIDVRRLDAEVRYENLEGGEEMFPHVYGAIPLAAVRSVTPLVPLESGAFDMRLEAH